MGTRAALVVAAALLAACAAREVLVARPAEPPPGVDFSGLWNLSANPAAERRRLDDAIRRTDGVDDGRVLRQVRTRDGRETVVVQRRVVGGLVHVFLQHGRQLKITQTASALFVSFDRAVVQEFRFGEHREVSVGPVIAQRVSGWEGDAYVVETLDAEGMKLTERYRLDADGTRLRRTIVLRARNGESVTIEQEFERVQS